MPDLAIVGGTGLTTLEGLSEIESKTIETPYGQPSSNILIGTLNNSEVAFLARHGAEHTIPPHKINYRANIWSLKSVGVSNIIAVAAVGGIHPKIPPKKIVIPDQIIDYTYDRKHTYFEDDLTEVTHIDFTYPYSEELRQYLCQAAKEIGLEIYAGGTYAATQGPRLETAAEIKRLAQDGCDIVGMTGMPEAALARELKLNYACCALSVNWGAGIVNKEITFDDISNAVKEGMTAVKKLLVAAIKII